MQNRKKLRNKEKSKGKGKAMASSHFWSEWGWWTQWSVGSKHQGAKRRPRWGRIWYRPRRMSPSRKLAPRMKGFPPSLPPPLLKTFSWFICWWDFSFLNNFCGSLYDLLFLLFLLVFFLLILFFRIRKLSSLASL